MPSKPSPGFMPKGKTPAWYGLYEIEDENFYDSGELHFMAFIHGFIVTDSGEISGPVQSDLPAFEKHTYRTFPLASLQVRT